MQRYVLRAVNFPCLEIEPIFQSCFSVPALFLFNALPAAEAFCECFLACFFFQFFNDAAAVTDANLSFHARQRIIIIVFTSAGTAYSVIAVGSLPDCAFTIKVLQRHAVFRINEQEFPAVFPDCFLFQVFR